ncbi:MAG TPA: glucose-1-phosphate adenylyltransferase [Candidatus Hydrogenedentes bacterium]|nr:glucose-1-phosphate adenylyltransferase [Candidatus Hydrogenedentota bacterium]
MPDSVSGHSTRTFDMTRDVVALVLGGGRGSRLRPLTSERAKPAVPLCGRYRLVDIPISNCLHSRINRVFLLTQFNSASLHRHVSNTYKFDAFSDGFVEILAAEQTYQSGDWYQGTADAVRKQLRHFRILDAKYFLILSGDQLYSMNYGDILKTHIDKGADITIAALPVAKDAARAFGVLQVDQGGRIVNFVEKPSDDGQFEKLVTPKAVFDDFGLESEGRDYLGSMGIYVFNAGLLRDLLLEHHDWNDFGHHVLPRSLHERTIFAHLFSGFWEDIGTVRSYYEVSIRMVQPDPPFEFHRPGHVVYSRARYLPGARVTNATVRNAMICEGCRVEDATIVDSIIGIRTVVGRGVTINRSIVMGDDYFEVAPAPGQIPIGIGEGSRIEGAIIDKNARIGKNVRIYAADNLPDQAGDGWAIRDGIVVVLKDATIPDGTVIGKA